MEKPAPDDTVETRQKRARVLQELLDTEYTFVENLHCFIATYIEHFRLENSEVKKAFAGNARVALLFTNIKQIHSINSDLLDRLKERVNVGSADRAEDETTTTPDLVDRNILYVQVFLKPARAIEYIVIDFIVTRSGAEFA